MHRGHFALNTPNVRTEPSGSQTAINKENCYDDLGGMESLYLKTGKKREPKREERV